MSFPQLKRLLLSNSRSFSQEAREPSVAEGDKAIIPKFGILRGRTSELLSRSRSKERSSHDQKSSPSVPYPLGLHILHEPNDVALDIILIHGLGGHSHNTWTTDHDQTLFWPATWLPFETQLESARILTYGYNAKWRGSAAGDSTIIDFAKELLFELRFTKNQRGVELGLGKRPIIFIAHSMGGLVVKKAYLLGLLDSNYQSIVGSISAIVFLSTPHRGTNLAEVLDQINTATFQSSKKFISDLQRNSRVIEDLNEQFRHVAPNISIWSFYETLKTTIGPKKLMILDKETSVLGYPSEVSKPMNADHRSICKYRSREDPNYLIIKNAVQKLASQALESGKAKQQAKETNIRIKLREIFGDDSIGDEQYYHTLLQQRVSGTCEWFLRQPKVVSWLSPCPKPQVLWYEASPGSGKSILSAFMIHHIRASSRLCQFFHFKYSDLENQTVLRCFNTLAFQLGTSLTEFEGTFSASSGASTCLDSGDAKLLWDNLFQSLTAKTAIEGPLYWVIDALDECDTPETFLQCLNGISSLSLPVKVLILSRSTDALVTAFCKLGQNISVECIESTASLLNQDIQLLVDQGINHIHGNEEFRNKLKLRIMERSEGSFLWTNLVLDEMIYCQTEEGIWDILDEVPNDMNLFYQRMEHILVQSTRKRNVPLIKGLVEWTVCSHRPLQLREMSRALSPEFSTILDLQRTIKDACGQFIKVDGRGTISLIHHTANEYFTRQESQFSVDTSAAHNKIFLKVMTELQEPTLRWDLAQNQRVLESIHPFILYSAVSWPYHLESCGVARFEHLAPLASFFSGSAILVWIHILASLRQLEVISKASTVIESLLRNISKKREVAQDLLTYHESNIALLNEWVVDLTKLVGKFGPNLVSEPAIIYNILPSMCPPQVAIARQYRNDFSSNVQVAGNEEESWSDNFGKLSLPTNFLGDYMLSSSQILAICTSILGKVYVWDTSKFLQTHAISHNEPVTAMALAQDGTKLATYGLKTIKMWCTSSGKQLFTAENPPLVKARTIAFAENSRSLLLGGDDNCIRQIFYEVAHSNWEIMHFGLLQNDKQEDGTVISSPQHLEFSQSRRYVAVSYRGAPLSVWRLVDGQCLSKFRRSKTLKASERRPSPNWDSVDTFTWNPISDHVIGIFQPGYLFKWHPLTEEFTIVHSPADRIKASPNGKLFATTSSDGSIRIWCFSTIRVLYEIKTDDLVTSLAFSPDCRRLYDLRGSIVNAWEPDIMACDLEVDKIDPKSVDESYYSSRLGFKVKTANDCGGSHISSFAGAPNKIGYCAGYDDGTLLFFTTDFQTSYEIPNFGCGFEITHTTWSNDGKYLAVANLGGGVMVHNVQVKGNDSVLFRQLPEPRFEISSSNFRGAIFSLDCKFVVFWTEMECFVCWTLDGSLQARIDIEDGNEHSWFIHPTNKEMIIHFTNQHMDIHKFQSFELLGRVSFQTLPRPPTEKNGSAMSLAASTLAFNVPKFPSEHISFSMAISSKYSDISLLFFCLGSARKGFKIYQVPEMPSTTSCKVKMESVLTTISEKIYIPLGILSTDKLAFLDHDLWFCTSSVVERTGDRPSYLRHYFIPRDWVDIKSLGNCILDEEGTLIWPGISGILRVKCDFDCTKAFPVWSAE